MKIGEVTFLFGDDVLDSNYVINRITISTGVMKLPTITFSGTLGSGGDSLIFKDEYNYTMMYKSKTWTGYVSFDRSALPTKGGLITFTGYLLPKELALGKSSRYYTSIADGINALCNGLKLPENLSSTVCYYNQLGKPNGAYALELAVRSAGYLIPGFDLEGLVLVDYNNGGDKVYDMTNLGSISDNTGAQYYKEKKVISDSIDLFDVTSRSGQFYGMVGVQASREIVSADYLSSYEAYAINSQLLDDSMSTFEVTVGDLAAANLGDTVYYGSPAAEYVIVGADITIGSGASETKYKIRKL